MAGGIAAAVIAWFARGDALRAEESAERAHSAAVTAWERAAGALEEANALQVRLTTEATERDRRATRIRIAQRASRIYLEAFLRAATGHRNTAAQRTDKRECVIALTGTGEPGAMQLGLLLEMELRSIARGDVDSATNASTRASKWADSWASDPAAFSEEHSELLSRDFLVDTLGDVMDAFNQSNPASTRDPGE